MDRPDGSVTKAALESVAAALPQRLLTVLHHKFVCQSRDSIYQLAKKSQCGQAASHGGHATQLQKVNTFHSIS